MNIRLHALGKSFWLALMCLNLIVTDGAAQSSDVPVGCGTDDMTRLLFEQTPGLEQEAERKLRQCWDEGKRNLERNRSSLPQVYIIPVVFHVLHDYGVENISDAQILDQVAILNRDFRKQNADTSSIVSPFDTLAADCEIEFRLATIDPNGNCTNGIDRIATMETYIGNDGSKLNQWPREKYLNIWVVKVIDGASGYAYYPSTVAGLFYIFDGIMIMHDHVGSIGTSNLAYSRTLTHEAGHYLNLQHVWGNTNAPGVSCGDDGIFDTPQTKGWATCELINNVICTSSQVENVQNYMEYSNCRLMFTFGQRDAMQFALNSSVSDRNNLWTISNLTATGCLNPTPICKPHADFDANRTMICEGGNLTMTDLSWSGDATSWNWTLTGPVTLNSSNQNPTFTLNSPGHYDVTLVASNATGIDTLTKFDYILVSSDTATFNYDYSEEFENPFVFYLGYLSNNSYGNASYFQQTGSCGHTGTSSAFLNNYGNSRQGDVDELITPAYFLDYIVNPQIQFSYSYATTNLTPDLNTQIFRLYYSINCGQTWNYLWARSDQYLCTGGYDANYFVPNDINLWETVTIPLPSNCASPNVRFKFEFIHPKAGIANNLYIDDINILGSNIGINSNDNATSFNIYPNPGDQTSIITYSLNEQANVTASLYDMTGRLIYIIVDQIQAPGVHSAPINSCPFPLAQGQYLIQMVVNDQISVKKYVITDSE